MMKRTLVVGVGNTIMGDDGIGIYLARQLGPEFGEIADFLETEEMGLSLLDFFTGYEQLILIDSISTAEKNIGKVHEIPLDTFEEEAGPSNHYLGLPDIIRIADRLSIPFPNEVHILAVEIAYSDYIYDGLSEELESVKDEVIYEVTEKLARVLQVECAGTPGF